MRVRAEVVIANPQGLHLRPATAFAKTAAASGCAVTVRTPRGDANGHSVLELAMLAATAGTRMEISVEGEGCREALDALVSLVAEGFDA